MIVMNNASIAPQIASYLVANLRAVAPAPAKIHLIKANFSPSQQSQIADFTEADYTGYAAQAASSWLNAAYIGNGKYESLSSAVLAFAPTAATVLDTIYGYWLADNNGLLVSVCKFLTPIVQTFSPLVTINILPSIQWGAEITQNDFSPLA